MVVTDDILVASVIDAIFKANITSLTKLLQNGANANAISDEGDPVLIMAIAANKTAIVKLLLKYNANPNCRARSDSALLMAVSVNNVEIAKVLLNAGADVNFANNDGVGALQRAALNGNAEIVRLFLQAGARVNAQQTSGTTALMIASMKGHADIVQILLENQADVNIVNNNKFSALSFARNHEYSEIINLLKQSGAAEPGADFKINRNSSRSIGEGSSFKNTSASSQSGGCFIATAVYGSYFAPEVFILRQFRDDVLHKNAFGRLFIKCYYLVSPPVADFISQKELLKKAARLLLIEPLVKVIKTTKRNV